MRQYIEFVADHEIIQSGPARSHHRSLAVHPTRFPAWPAIQPLRRPARDGSMSFTCSPLPPSGCTRLSHSLTPPSRWRWPSTRLDSTKSCLLYTNGRSYGHDAMTDVRGAPSLGASVSLRALAWKSYRSLTTRTTVHPAGDPSPDGSLEVHKREDYVSLLSLHLS
jgi:hypothetical protein